MIINNFLNEKQHRKEYQDSQKHYNNIEDIMQKLHNKLDSNISEGKCNFINLEFSLKFPTSVYTAIYLDNRLYVGSSDWDRRNVLYTKNIAQNSEGILYIVNQNNDKYDVYKKLNLPSMVYSITPTYQNQLFVGCKGQKKTLNIIDTEGRILYQKDDNIGEGVYNAIYKNNNLLLTSRLGKLQILNAQNLDVQNTIQLTLSTKDRLWSIDYDDIHNTIYTGDYLGILYKIENNHNVKKINLRDLHISNNQLSDDFGPSLWGLNVIDDKIITGDRWGGLFVFDKNLNLQKKIYTNKSITSILSISKNLVLLGTRFGELLLYNLQTDNLYSLLQILPILQKENAIWDITNNNNNNNNNNILVSFADGNVLNILNKV